MYNLMHDYIKQRIIKAMKRHRRYVKIRKTHDDDVDQAICQVIDSWGYKTAFTKEYIAVIL